VLISAGIVARFNALELRAQRILSKSLISEWVWRGWKRQSVIGQKSNLVPGLFKRVPSAWRNGGD